MTKVTDDMNDAADMVEARNRRRAADEQALNDILAANSKLTKLLETVDGLSGEGFEFIVTKGFSPETAGDVMEPYRAPLLVRDIHFVTQLRDQLTMTLSLDGVYTFSIPDADEESTATPVKNTAWKMADAWIVAQHAAKPDLGILSAFHRKDQQAVAKRPDQKPSTPKAA